MVRNNNNGLSCSVVRMELMKVENKWLLDVLEAKGNYENKIAMGAWMDETRKDKDINEKLGAISGNILFSQAVGRLSYGIPTYREMKGLGKFKCEEGKSFVAKTILNILVDLKLLVMTEEDISEIDDNGKKTYKTVQYLDFGEAKEQDMLKGQSEEEDLLLNKYIKTKPGGLSVKLNSKEKAFAKGVSAMDLRVVRVPREVVMGYYEQTTWYKNVFDSNVYTNEDPILLKARVSDMADKVMELMDKPRLSLSVWFCARTRMYYNFKLPGLNPHGDSFETHMWELTEPRVITKRGAKHLADIVVTIAVGRKSRKIASNMWSKNKEKYLKMISTKEHYKDSNGEWERGGYGDHFYGVRLVQAYRDYKSGTPSHFMAGKDATTGGLQHMSLAFHSSKSMKGCNVGGNKTPGDTHSAIDDAFGIGSRYIAKTTVNTPLLHGSTWKTISKQLEELTKTAISVSEVEEHSVSVYGPEIANVGAIADWGTLAVDNVNSSLIWTTADGWKAQSTAYSESVRLTVYGLSLSAKAGFNTTVVHRDMPLFIVKKKSGKDKKDFTESVYEKTKTRGLYANITHSIDATALRSVARWLISVGASGLFKHDKFYTHLSDMDGVVDEYKEFLVEEFNGDLYHKALVDASMARRGTAPRLPELIYGNGTLKMLEASENFLMA